MHHFSSIEDPRVNRQKKHKLQDIFFISLCAVICGADNWVAIEKFGVAKEQWFTEMLGLEHGIPSHETFGAVYTAIDEDSNRTRKDHRAANLAVIRHIALNLIKAEKTAKVGVKIKRLKSGVHPRINTARLP